MQPIEQIRISGRALSRVDRRAYTVLLAVFSSNVASAQVIQRASATAANLPATAGIAVLSGDGRFVFFEQSADFRVEPPTVANGQLYRREFSTGHLDLVSVDLAGDVAFQGVNSSTYESCASSHDGRFVAFSSREEDLALNDGNGQLSDVPHDAAVDASARVERGHHDLGQYFCRDPAFSAPDQLAFTEGMRFTVVP